MHSAVIVPTREIGITTSIGNKWSGSEVPDSYFSTKFPQNYDR